ncbi:hypothetical protein F5051DRAFT_434575 [Lentinula edodes]|nr:hypothetical protein F5051DRAFT_434575 [Lentinula edodes]
MSAVGSLLFLSMIILLGLIIHPDTLMRCKWYYEEFHQPRQKKILNQDRIAQWLEHLGYNQKGTIDYELELGPDPTAPDLITAISDSDLGGNKDNGKSTTGYIIKIGSVFIGVLSNYKACSPTY